MWQTELIHSTQNYLDSNKYWAKKNRTKNKAWTGVALETDLMNNDINVCVVVRETSQTRKAEIVVNIPSLYSLREE